MIPQNPPGNVVVSVDVVTPVSVVRVVTLALPVPASAGAGVVAVPVGVLGCVPCAVPASLCVLTLPPVVAGVFVFWL
jgi:hypothetical protein